MPEVYNQQGYNGNEDIYIVSSEGYRYKVKLNIPRNGPWFLDGKRWTDFCNQNLTEDVEMLHFVEEGDDCFYVTGYNSDGKEVGGYTGNKSTYSRFKTTVLPEPHLPQVFEIVII